MIAALTSLWKELSGSYWILILLPSLMIIRWILSSKWPWLGEARYRFFRLPFWDSILAFPSEGGIQTGGSLPAPCISIESAGDLEKGAVEFRRKWFLEVVESGLIALSLVFLLIRPFLLQAFYIPSQSMEETLQIDDRILVNKLIYRFHSPRVGDIVVFEPPARASQNTHEDWIKRVIGVEGDRIAVRHNHLFVNGIQQAEPYVALLDPSPESDGIGMKHIHTGQYNYSFPDAEIIAALDGVRSQPGQNTRLCLETDGLIQEPHYVAYPTTQKIPSIDDTALFFLHNDPGDGFEVVVPPGKLFVMGDNRNNSDDSHCWGYLDENRVLGQAFCIFWPLSHARFLADAPVPCKKAVDDL